MKTFSYFLEDEQATVKVGSQLAMAMNESSTQRGLIVFLNGDLGAGKTTLTRGFVRQIGHKGNVKSPTYTLVEPYELPPWRVFHFDLYRLSDPEELEYMGIRDYFATGCCCFIEWPEKGEGLLAQPDLSIELVYKDEQRAITLTALNEHGLEILSSVDLLRKTA
jgi:tRNA threonylcarbamoyladenosine biosynthesis protein TsaE